MIQTAAFVVVIEGSTSPLALNTTPTSKCTRDAGHGSFQPRNPYRGYRFPEEIISQCVWLYFNFAVSLREVELMMAYRGIQLSYETIRRCCDTFGPSYAAKLKRKRPKLGDKWFLDEVFLKINGVQHYLWRAVDQQGTVIDILVQPKRDRFAAIRFFFASCCAPPAGLPA
jgi:putative transposase